MRRRQLAEKRLKRNRLIAGAVAVVAVVAIVFGISTALSPAPSQKASGTPAGTESPQEGTSGNAQQQGTAATAAIGVEDPWVPSGRFTTGDAELDNMVKTFCDDCSKEGQSAEENAYDTYLGVAWGNYIERYEGEEFENQNPSGDDWDIRYAKQYILGGGGNCYEFTAFIGFCLQYFGYADAHSEPCLVLLESGGWGDHALVFVTDKDGSSCLCDSSLGSNGWMLPRSSYTYEVKDVGQGEFTPNTSVGVA